MTDVIKLVREAKQGKLRPEREGDWDLTEAEREEGGRKYTGAQLITLRSRAAAAMRVHGTPYAEIAEVLEYESEAAARVAVETALVSTVTDMKAYESLRAISSLRIEALLKVSMEGALRRNADQLSYLRAAGGFIDRYNALHGLNAPQRIQMVNPDAQEFENVITVVLEAQRGGEPKESDPFALEAVPSGAIAGPEDADV